MFQALLLLQGARPDDPSPGEEPLSGSCVTFLGGGVLQIDSAREQGLPLPPSLFLSSSPHVNFLNPWVNLILCAENVWRSAVAIISLVLCREGMRALWSKKK
jgi:hypothetical protein